MTTAQNTLDQSTSVADSPLTADEREELAALREEKRKAGFKGSNIKVSQKGAVSVYGLGRFPVTLYKSQWEKLFEQIPAVKEFIAAHDGELSVKD